MPKHFMVLGVVQTSIISSLENQVQRSTHRTPASCVDLIVQLPGQPRRILEEEAEILRSRPSASHKVFNLIAAAIEYAVGDLSRVLKTRDTVDHVYALAHVPA